MKIKFSLFFFFLIISQQIIAQEKITTKTIIPFSLLENKYVLIQVSINSKLLTFYFDTGAASSLIDVNSAGSLGISANYETEVAGAGGKQTYRVALNQKIKLQETVLDSISLIFDDLSRLKKIFGFNFDGIIGADILKRYITEINFDKKVIILYPFSAKPNVNNYNENSFSFYGNSSIPVLNTTFQLKNGKTYTGNVLFDSGAGLTLFVNTPFKEKNNLIQQVNKVYSSSSSNLSNKTMTQKTKIHSLSFGGNRFFDLPISLSSDKSGVSSDPSYLGILGNEIINRFNLILNYQTKKIYLTRNGLYNQPFDFPVSGLKILENEAGEYYISEISEESELYKKGVRQNDILISVNDVTKASIAYFRQQLDQENKEISIKTKGALGTKEFKITLKRLI